MDPNVPGSAHPAVALAERLAAIERQLRGLNAPGSAIGQIPVVDVLPTFGREGRVVVLRSDWHVYLDTGLAWRDIG